jgi:hypothetical protein
MTMKVVSWLRLGLLSSFVAAGTFRTGRAALLLAALTIGSLSSASPAGANGVAFNTGDVLANVGGGFIKHFSTTGTLLDTLDSTTGTNEGDGMCFDAAGNLYATEGFSANTVSKFDTNGNLVAANFGSGYNSHPESCVFDSANHIYVGQPDGTHNVLEFDTSGTPLGSFAPAIEDRGTDWLDLASDQCSLHYTSEGSTIKRFDICTNTQLTDFASGLPAPCYGHRILTDGGQLVACASEVVRLDSAGAVIQTYPASSYASSYFFAMNLDPDGVTFWTADYFSGLITRINIATGATVTSFSAAPVSPLGGIAIVGEITVAVPTTTTTSSSTTTTEITTTTTIVTTTTTMPVVCGDGVVDGSEQCDPPSSSSSQCASGGLCTPTCECCVTTGPEAGHCGDAKDNDCNGLTDCKDTAGCPPGCIGGTHNGGSCETTTGARACAGGGGVCQCQSILRDPTTIEFGRNGRGHDVLTSHGRVLNFGPPINIAASEVRWLLSNDEGNIFSAVLPAGSMKASPSGRMVRYFNRNARTGGGVYRAWIRITSYGTSYGYRLQAYGDMSGATSANMAIQFYFGEQSSPAIHAATWDRTVYGWRTSPPPVVK